MMTSSEDFVSNITTGITSGANQIATGVGNAAVKVGENLKDNTTVAFHKISEGVEHVQKVDIIEKAKTIVPSFLSGGALDVRKLLKLQVERNASDLHLITNEKPRIRTQKGSIVILEDFPPITNKDTKEVIKRLMPTKEKMQIFEEEKVIDVAVFAEGIGRFRLNAYMERNGVGMVFRHLPENAPTLESILGEKTILEDLAKLDSGLVLVAGQNDSGKTTTIGAMVDYINKNRDKHILILEDPIEIIHKPVRSLISHREIGKHSKDYSGSIKHALRQDIDVVVIGELRDFETINAAIEMAESGYLVLASLHTSNVVDSIQHIVGTYSRSKQDLIQHQLSTVLRAVVCQKLIARIDRTGRIACREVLVNNGTVANIIREGEFQKLPKTMEIQSKDGSKTFEQDLGILMQERKISKETYLEHSSK